VSTEPGAAQKGEGAMEMHAMKLLKFTVWVVFFFLEELEL
jgi:hypothetical protein